MSYQWRQGGVPPQIVRGGHKQVVPVEEVMDALDALPEPSPEKLLAASKEKDHVLHYELWHDPDSVWAGKARLHRCRQIIASVHEVILVGGKDISTRAVEYVKPEGSEPAWVRATRIARSPRLMKAYRREVTQLLQQAMAKMARYEELASAMEEEKARESRAPD